MIGHRNAQQVISAEEICNVFLIVRCRNGDVVGIHQRFKNLVIGGKEQRSNGDDSFKHPIPGSDVTRINGLLVLADLPDVSDRFLDAHLFLQLNELGGHDRPCGELGVEEELVDQASGLWRGVAENPVDKIRRQFADHIDRIVDHEPFHQVLKLPVGDCADQQFLLIVAEVRKDLRRQILFQSPEHQQRQFGGKAFNEGGYVNLLHMGEFCLQNMPIA
ncbi:MAG: hypothetical protein BWY50_02177 [Spirochaetes bacterium ADurb.Bin315]|nr:MAG: hypothetical protein BWY50_02177 [Spirochaetes bacterium ADurb.Bin315]